MTQSSLQLVQAALQRLRRVSVGLWLILLAGSFTPVLLDELFNLDVDTPRLISFAFPVTILVFALVIFGFWKLERSVANYQNRRGDFFAWFGWSLLAYSPMIIGAIAMYRIEPDGDVYLESVNVMLVAFTAPLLVHASGRAIDEHGPPMNLIWSYWSSHYWTLAFAYLLSTGPLLVAGDIVWQLTVEGRLNVVVAHVVSGLLYLGGSVWAVALTVEAFHRAEQTEIEAT